LALYNLQIGVDHGGHEHLWQNAADRWHAFMDRSRQHVLALEASPHLFLRRACRHTMREPVPEIQPLRASDTAAEPCNAVLFSSPAC